MRESRCSFASKLMGVGLGLGIAMFFGCHEESTEPIGDTAAPAAVADLAAGSESQTAITLTWTAPGDDGGAGTASVYDIRYSTSPIHAGNWASATAATGEPAPHAPGTTEAFTVTGLQPGTLYSFAIETADEVPNWSPLSNVAEGTTQAETPPGFVRVTHGTFMMGSPPDEPGRGDDELQHEVTLTRDFFIGEHEVTQAEWIGYMLWNDSEEQESGLPVGYVTWYDCLSYCNLRSAGEGLDSVYALTYRVYQDHHIMNATVQMDLDKNGYRLPTEAQWEYACRAGSTTAFCNGGITNTECAPIEPNLAMVGWYCGNIEDGYHLPEMKMPNDWGIYDMHGNVCEWCFDMYDAYTAGHATDPVKYSGSYRVFRGGSISNYARWCRSAKRSSSSYPQSGNIGLRVMRYAP
jgi:formylglycine-generating enzyme required for sulfatase activity